MLPQLLESKKYSTFYQERKADGDYIILDNGVAEGAKIGHYDLIEAIHQVEPDEFVLPDVMGDCDRTIEAVRDFLEFGRDSIRLKYSGAKPIGVLQGKSFQELFKIMGFYQSIGVRIVAVPRVLCKLLGHKLSRVTFIESITNKKLEHFIYEFDTWHCLGSSDWIQEVAALNGTGARSIDTCLPISLALQGYTIELNAHKQRPKSYFNLEEPDDYTRKLIEHNIDVYLTLAGAQRPEWSTETPTS